MSYSRRQLTETVSAEFVRDISLNLGFAISLKNGHPIHLLSPVNLHLKQKRKVWSEILLTRDRNIGLFTLKSRFRWKNECRRHRKCKQTKSNARRFNFPNCVTLHLYHAHDYLYSKNVIEYMYIYKRYIVFFWGGCLPGNSRNTEITVFKGSISQQYLAFRGE